jgi:hypothetical protein
LYFSAGDRYAYEVSKHIDIMRTQLENSPAGAPQNITKKSLEGLIHLLLKASKSWVNVEDVKDMNGKESLLTYYCNLLSQLGSVGQLGIVQVCLSAARNFDAPTTSIGNNRGSIDKGKVYVEGSLEWDRSLYHIGSALTDEQKMDGREACYKCLSFHFENVLTYNKLSSEATEDNTETVRLMVDAVVEGSSDSKLRSIIFSILLRQNVNELLRIQLTDVEKFLHEVDPKFDYSYLYRYAILHIIDQYDVFIQI